MLLYSNVNAKLGTPCFLCVLDDCKKRGYCLKYRAPIWFWEEDRQEAMMTGLRHRQKIAIEFRSDHL